MGTVVLIGTGAEFFKTCSVVAFRRVGGLRVFKVRNASARLLAPMCIGERTVCIVNLDWCESEQWPQQMREIITGTAHFDAEYVLTAHNFASAARGTAAALLSRHFDTCHQYLRTMALRLGGYVMYSIDATHEFNWSSIAMAILNKDRAKLPPPCLYGSEVAVYEDTREQILALDPAFDFDRAYDNMMNLPTLVQEPELQHDHLDLRKELKRIIDQHSETGSVSGPVAPKGDSEVISEFFSKLISN